MHIKNHKVDLEVNKLYKRISRGGEDLSMSVNENSAITPAGSNGDVKE